MFVILIVRYFHVLKRIVACQHYKILVENRFGFNMLLVVVFIHFIFLAIC